MDGWIGAHSREPSTLEALGGDEQPWHLYLRSRKAEIMHVFRKAAGQLDIFALTSEQQLQQRPSSIVSSSPSRLSMSLSPRTGTSSPRASPRRSLSLSASPRRTTSAASSHSTQDESTYRVAAVTRVCAIASQQLWNFSLDASTFIERQREKQASPEGEQEALLLVAELSKELSTLLGKLLFLGDEYRDADTTSQQPPHEAQQPRLALALPKQCVLQALECYGTLMSETEEETKRAATQVYSTLKIQATAGSPGKLVRDKFASFRQMCESIVKEFARQLTNSVIARTSSLLSNVECQSE